MIPAALLKLVPALPSLAIPDFGKFDKDARRIAMFTHACQAKALELLATNPKMLPDFMSASSHMAGRWVEGFSKAHKKISLASIFSKKDPFFNLREDTRVFAKVWKLDPKFIKEMG